ncbi:MAG: M48 family metalloprotease [Saprospiraceae bacterium]|nr:M48 family metalloprotease [Saprospiraceae bacterium]
MKKLFFPILAFLFLFSACEQAPTKVVSINPDVLTIEDQAKIGDAFQLALETNTTTFNILDRSEYPEAYSYVEQLFNTMLNTAQVQRRQDFDWTVKIIHDDEVRTAFFLPGGHFYIYTGLLKFLDSESELLGVIGHEMYYVDSDLLINRIKQEYGGIMLGDILLENPVPELPDYAADVQNLTFAEPKVILADSFAVEMICPFLYEPSGIEKILEKAAEEDVQPLWLSSRQGKYETRLLHLSTEATKCGLPGVSNEENYLKFKSEYLPN